MESQLSLGITLERRLRVIDLVTPHLRGRVLDWGCHAGVDDCVYRLRFGDDLELHGADIVDPFLYKPFYDFSGLRYRQLTDGYLLDYPAGYFDVVVSDGVLEHVPDEHNSLREIHRILKPDGSFVVTCLPNRFSYTELYHRRKTARAHDRLYRVRTTRSMLERRGFEVSYAKRFFMMPTMLNGLPEPIRHAYQRRESWVWRVNDALEALWPLNLLASNLMLVARKRNR